LSIPEAPNGQQAQQPASSQAITALVVGLIGIVSCCYLLSPIAWYIGSQEVKAIRQGRSPASGEVLAKVGVILGLVGTALLVVSVLFLSLGGLAVLTAFWQAAVSSP
jgi:hypothetical protein